MPRSAGYIPSAFWVEEETFLLRQYPDTMAVACYLLSSPLSNIYGFYKCPREFVAKQLRMPWPERTIGLLEDFGFCTYDRATGFVWVISAARWAIRDAVVEATDPRSVAASYFYEHLPPCRQLPDFYDRYASFLRLSVPRRGADGDPAPVAERFDGTTVDVERRTWHGRQFRRLYFEYPPAARGEPTEGYKAWRRILNRLPSGERTTFVDDVVLPGLTWARGTAAWIKKTPTLAAWIRSEGWREKPPLPVLGAKWKAAAADYRNRLLVRVRTQPVEVVEDDDADSSDSK